MSNLKQKTNPLSHPALTRKDPGSRMSRERVDPTNKSALAPASEVLRQRDYWDTLSLQQGAAKTLCLRGQGERGDLTSGEAANMPGPGAALFEAFRFRSASALSEVPEPPLSGLKDASKSKRPPLSYSLSHSSKACLQSPCAPCSLEDLVSQLLPSALKPAEAPVSGELHARVTSCCIQF